MNGAQKNMKQIVAAVERKTGDGEVKSWWTRVGVAFENSDGSFNLLFDFVPTDMQKTTLQLRSFDQERRERPADRPRRRSPRREQRAAAR